MSIDLLMVAVPEPVNFLKQLSGRSIFYAAVSLLGAYLMIRIGSTAIRALSRQSPRSRFFFKLFAPLFRFAMWIAGTFLAIAALAPSHDTMLALIAAVGVAVGLGSQDLVKNLIGGVIILTDRPYQLGDRVKIGDAYGEIDHIGLRSTKLTTPDDTRITIPNSEILSGKAWNVNSGAPECLVVTDLFLPITTDPNEAIEVGKEAASSSPYTALGKPVVSLVQDAFQNHPYVRLRIKAWVFDHRFEPAFQSDITRRTKTELLRRGMLDRWNSIQEAV